MWRGKKQRAREPQGSRQAYAKHSEKIFQELMTSGSVLVFVSNMFFSTHMSRSENINTWFLLYILFTS